MLPHEGIKRASFLFVRWAQMHAFGVSDEIHCSTETHLAAGKSWLWRYNPAGGEGNDVFGNVCPFSKTEESVVLVLGWVSDIVQVAGSTLKTETQMPPPAPVDGSRDVSRPDTVFQSVLGLLPDGQPRCLLGVLAGCLFLSIQKMSSLPSFLLLPLVSSLSDWEPSLDHQTCASASYCYEIWRGHSRSLKNIFRFRRLSFLSRPHHTQCDGAGVWPHHLHRVAMECVTSIVVFTQNTWIIFAREIWAYMYTGPRSDLHFHCSQLRCI